MKQRLFVYSLLVTVLSSLFPLTASAQQTEEQYAIFNWQNNGDFNAFLNSDVDSITFSRIALDGKVHSNVVVQEIWTNDSLYRIPLATIDSVAFRAPEPIFKEGLFHMTVSHLQYIMEVTDSTVTFSSSIPTSMLPCIGQVLVTDVYDEPLNRGFAGRVMSIDSSSGMVRIVCGPVSIEDVFDQLVCVGKAVSTNAGNTPAGAPRRINEEGITTFDLGDWCFYITDGVQLNVAPSVSLDYAICYSIFSNNNRFKCIVNNNLDCSFDFSLEKEGTKNFSHDFATIPIPTGLWFLGAQLNVGGFMDLVGSIKLEASLPFTIHSQFGYDSQLTDNNGFVCNFNGTHADLPIGSVDFNASAHAGLSLKFVTFILDEDLASANLRLKAGPRVSGDIEFSTIPGQPISGYTLIKDSRITFEPLVASLSAGVNTLFTDEEEWDLLEVSLLGERAYYLFPEFTEPSLPNINNAYGCSLTALTTNISRNLLFPITPGLGLYDSNHDLVDSVFATNTYKKEEDWNIRNLQMELQQKYPTGTYTAVPIFKSSIFSPIEASQSAMVTIPDPLSVEVPYVSLKRGNSQDISMNGGWGNYTINIDNSDICSAVFASSSGNIESSVWPPYPGYENQEPKLRIRGLNNGIAKMTLTDLRSGNEKTINIVVSETGAEPSILVNPTSLEFGTVNMNDTAIRVFSVLGTNLTGDLTLLSDHTCYTVSPTTISAAEAASGKTVTVTYKPNTFGTHNGSITINGGDAEKEKVNLTGATIEQSSITVSPSAYDFGLVNVGETKTKDFTVTGTNLNESITFVSQSETTGIEFTVSPTSLPPSGGTITVTYKPIYEGNASHEFILGSDVSTRINVTGTGVVPPTIKPSVTSLDFGTVYKGKTASKIIMVRGVNLTGDLTLSSSRPWFAVSPTTITAAEANNGKEVTVTYVPTVGGDHNAILTISGGNAESKEVSLSGKCASVEITPSTHDFGTVKANEGKSMTFTVTGTNLNDRIVLTWPQEDGFTVTPDNLPASGGKVIVTFKPTSGGNYSQQYTLSSGNASAKITVTGKCAAITTNKSALSFGTVRKGETKTQTFKVTGVNLTHDLTLTSSNSTLFQVSPTTITAAEANNGKEVTVTYAPTVCKDHSGTITISGQDITNKTVSLFGKCANITVSPASYDFGTKIKGQTYTKTFTVTGTNLSQRISIVSTNDGFTVSPTDLPASGGTVTVTFKPTSAGSSYSQEFTCSSDLTTKFIVSGKCGVPSYTTDPSSLTFVCNSSKTFTVKGSYLTGSLSLVATGDCFTVTPTTITASEAATGKTVTVKCTANGTQSNCTGKIIITGGDAPSKTVKLFYNPGGNDPVLIGLVEPESEGEDGNDEFSNVSSQEAIGDPTTDVNEMAMASKVYAEGVNIIIETPIEQKALISDIAGHVREVNL